MQPHNLHYSEVLQRLKVNPDTGLDHGEASNRLNEYGRNILREGKKKSDLQRFFEQFKDVMIIILILAAVISFVVAWYDGEGFFEP
ncbi:MAG: hypothetical protein GX808_09220, partial [Syntrophomonadaceae bacterium]|nr:hypothetical protein [Syntrophomonadaceae bacterium]